jgi:tetratricopeptide (TPR) repeat protein
MTFAPAKAAAAAALLVLASSCVLPGEERAAANRRYREALHLLSRTGDLQEPLRLLDEAILYCSDRAEFFTARAQVLRLLGYADDAIEDYERAVELQKRHGAPPEEIASALLARGVLHAQARRLEAAEADFAEALRHAPGHPHVLLERARLHRALGRPEDARRDLEEARRAGGPAAADAFANEAVRILNLGRPAEAERLFEGAADLDPANARAWLGLGRARMELRRWEGAAEAFSRAAELRPDDAEIHYHRGNALFALSRLEDAFAAYDLSLRLDDTRAAAWAARGILHHRLFHDFDKADADFRRALELDPSLDSAWLNRGLLYRDFRRPAEAERDLRQALRLRTGPEGLHALGQVLADQGSYDAALDAFSKALLLCRDDALRRRIEADAERARDARDKERRESSR